MIYDQLSEAEREYLDDIYEQAKTGQRDLDVARARTLLAKHGMTL